MNALLKPMQLQWRAAGVLDIDRVLGVEQRAYSHPWTRGNFIDSLAAGHWFWLAEDEALHLCCYWLAMPVLDELHLLNLAVEPTLWGRGLGQQALEHLHAEAAARGQGEVWLEVRESNARAQALYDRLGYATVGRRRAYYPAAGGMREDALLMRRMGAAP